jgi:hypothetical protein
MNNLDLNAMGVNEMSMEDMREFDGGCLWLLRIFSTEWCDFGGVGWGPGPIYA